MLEEKYDVYEHDVLVIGAGGAGLRAAIEAAEAGVSVGLVCKSLLGKAHTVMAEGGIAAALGNVDKEDNWKVHFRDTMFGGKFINDWRMVEIHAKEAPERVLELERWGALFDRTQDGRILQRAFGGHTYKRLSHVGDHTGLEMIRTLQNRAIHLGVEVYMECTIVKLFKDKGKIAGAMGYWRETGRFVIFRSKSIILATGGIGKIYKITSNSWEYTGDGIWLALDIGAELRDMEFVQFHPTGMVWPPSARGILVTEAVRGEGGRLYNSKGERFMEKYDPKRMELSTRDVVARAIYTEIKEGRGTEHGGVYLDISHLPPEIIKKKLPGMYKQFLDLADIDITKQPMEVAPTCHYIMGGIRVHPETQMTSVPGLFAAGECASGLHGANRLGGNSLSDLLVFGKRAGFYAAQFAKETDFGKIDSKEVEKVREDILKPFEKEGGENPYQIHKELQETMQEKVGIFRKEDEMNEALEKIEELKKRYEKIGIDGSRTFNPAWHLTISLKFMLEIAKCITLSAIERKESRGGHARLDYPQTDKNYWQKVNIIIRKENGEIKLYHEPIPQIREDLKKLIEDLL